MQGYRVELECTNLGSYRSNEQWGDWSAESEHELVGISRCEEYPDIVSSLDIKDGEKCFVVWVQWSSGDSFGHHSGAYSEAFAVFKDKACAEAFAKALRAADVEKQSIITFESEDGQTITINYFPFYGYFESVDFIEVAEMRMGCGGRNNRF